VPNLRAMVVIKNRNNLPEDAVVNTFHFSGTTAKDDDSIPARLIAFYNTVAPSAVNSVGYYLSNMLSRAANSAEVRVYDMGDAKPREPAVTKWALDDLGGSSWFPNEVAACLSFYAGRNIPRRRGRIYIGPLSTNAGEADLTAGDMRLTTDFRNTLVLAAGALRSPTAGSSWCTHSTVDGGYYPVTAGWVDNAFDTQRRRGKDPTARTLFDAAS
jgi:hypothetical protein